MSYNNVELVKKCRDMRIDIINMAYNCGTLGAHIGGSMSCVEILAVLYTEVINLEGGIKNRDCFIMSKAHSAMALYAALRQAGILSQADIDTAMMEGSYLYKHPCMNPVKGIEFSGGSLGQGLSLGAGVALGYKLLGKNDLCVYVLLGDGECNEGAVWEAAAFATQYSLDNLTIIIDKNRLQNDGTTSEVMNFDNMANRWKAFGFNVFEVDGHNVEELYIAFIQKQNKPKVIVANTVKGKGVSFAENAVEWHASYLSKELYEQAMEEI